MLVYISCVAKAGLFAAVFSQLSIFTADCLRHPIQMAGVETIWELHTLPVINSWYYTCIVVQVCYKGHAAAAYRWRLPLYSLPLTVCAELSKNCTIRPHGAFAVLPVKASFQRGRRARARPARKVWYGDEARLHTLFKRARLHAEARRRSNHAHMQQQLATLEDSPGREDRKRHGIRR